MISDEVVSPLLCIYYYNSTLLTYFVYLLSFVIVNMKSLSRAPKHVWTKEEGGHSSCVFSGVGFWGWMEVEQRDVSIRLAGLTCPNDVCKVAWMSYPSHYYNRLPN